jgi:hypothetical protein
VARALRLLLMRGKRAARQMNARAASAEGKARAAHMVRCPNCSTATVDKWYSTRNTVATELHESGRCS